MIAGFEHAQFHSQLDMTLIARIRFRGMPLYIGDLLVSRDGEAAEQVDIPASKDINAMLPTSVGRSIVGLQQKIIIVNDRLIVSWAGSYIQARALIRDIRTAVDRGASSYEAIDEVIENVPESDRNDVSLIGTVLTPDSEQRGATRLSNFHYGACRCVFGDVEVVAAGTGADDLFQLLQQILAAEPLPNCDRESDEFFNCVMKLGYALTAYLVGDETSTGQNILDWWGGAFEVATYTSGKFEKFSNSLHTSWRAVRVNPEKYEIQLGPRFVKYDYFGNALVAQTLNLSSGQAKGLVNIEEHSCRIYTPFLESESDSDFSKFSIPSFSHKALCCYVFIEPQVENLRNLVRVYYSDSGDTPFRLQVRSKNIQFSLRDDLIRDIENSISTATGINATFGSND